MSLPLPILRPETTSARWREADRADTFPLANEETETNLARRADRHRPTRGSEREHRVPKARDPRHHEAFERDHPRSVQLRCVTTGHGELTLPACLADPLRTAPYERRRYRHGYVLAGKGGQHPERQGRSVTQSHTPGPCTGPSCTGQSGSMESKNDEGDQE